MLFYVLFEDHYRLIYALGIPQIGQQTAKDIAEAFNDDFLNFWNYIKSEAGKASHYLSDVHQMHRTELVNTKLLKKFPPFKELVRSRSIPY